MKHPTVLRIEINKRTAMTFIVLAVLAYPAYLLAGTVTIPNTFVSGQPAIAAAVNANFTAVKTAVDDNDSRIAVVEGQLGPSNSPGAVGFVSYHYSNGTGRYIHIRTPFNDTVPGRFRIDLRGYATGSPPPFVVIDLAYVATGIQGGQAHCSTLDPTGNLSPQAYRGSDGLMYLRFQVGSPAAVVEFNIYSMYLNAEPRRMLGPSDLTVIRSDSSTL